MATLLAPRTALRTPGWHLRVLLLLVGTLVAIQGFATPMMMVMLHMRTTAATLRQPQQQGLRPHAGHTAAAAAAEGPATGCFLLSILLVVLVVMACPVSLQPLLQRQHTLRQPQHAQEHMHQQQQAQAVVQAPLALLGVSGRPAQTSWGLSGVMM